MHNKYKYTKKIFAITNVTANFTIYFFKANIIN